MDPSAPTVPIPLPRRELWPDLAKGVCIVLVVLWHVVTKHYLQIDWKTSLPLPAAWGTLGEQLLPLRMPLFFTVSGYFAVRAVQRSWPTLLRSKVALFAYLYLLWTTLHTVIFALTPDFNTLHASNFGEFLRVLTIDPTNVWYLYALAIYFAVAKATRSLPPRILLPFAFALSALAATHLITGETNASQALQNLAWFLTGLHLHHLVTRLAREASFPRLFGWGSGFVTAGALMSVLNAQTWPGIWPVVSAVAVGFGVTAASLLSQAQSLRVPVLWLAELGRRTLPIYVMHLPILALAHLALEPFEPRGPILAALDPVLLTAGLIAVCLKLHNGGRRWAPWLFEVPRARSEETRSTRSSFSGPP